MTISRFSVNHAILSTPLGIWRNNSPSHSATQRAPGRRVDRRLAHGHRLPGRPGGGLAALEHDYIRQHYEFRPGSKPPSARHVSEMFGPEPALFLRRP